MLEDIYKIGLIAKKYQEQVMDSSIIPDKITKMDKVFSIDFNEKLEYIGVSIQDINKNNVCNCQLYIRQKLQACSK